MALAGSVSIMSADTEICLLGSASIMVDGTKVDRFRWSRIPALLGYLLINTGPRSRESIAEALWPDREPDKARHNLRQTLLYLQELVGDATPPWLKVKRQTIEIDGEHVWCDVKLFLEPVSPQATDREKLRFHELRIQIYQGPFLDGFDDDWIVEARAQIGRNYFDSLNWLANYSLEHNPERSLELSELAIRLEPFEDQPRVNKIKALRGLGRASSALKEFRDYEQLLDSQLGLQPGRLVLAIINDSKIDQRRPPAQPDLSDAVAPSIFDTLAFLKAQGLKNEAADVVFALIPFWIRQGNPKQGADLLIQIYEEAGKPLGNLEKLFLARLYLVQGDSNRCSRTLDEIAQNTLATTEFAHYCLNRARIDLQDIRPRPAKRHIIEALRLARVANDRKLQLEGWSLLAIERFIADEFHRVDVAANRAIAIAEEFGDSLYKGHVSVYKAFAKHRLGESSTAKWIVQGILSSVYPVDTGLACQTRASASRLLEDLGEIEAARAGYLSCIEDARRLNHIGTLVLGLTYLGDLESGTSRHKEAP